ncbi:ComF family protein [Aureimonas fodinaquatilis]|uniref:ComF family protein n=1 Tax=Aureimonas fodinaquatilis TaxID=2565783 RepID=A0A5B0E4H9_9HYPH|nr:ComF family protein [Aureimonas fodinaquatilis]
MVLARWREAACAYCRRILALPLNLVFPPVCTGCNAATTLHATLCASCWSGMHFIERPLCDILGIPLEFDEGDTIVSPFALAEPPPFARARSAVLHNGLGRSLVSRLKYGDQTQLAIPMARWMVRAGADLLPGADMVVPVPLHRRRLFVRRYNQAAELARHLAGLTSIAYRPMALERWRYTRTQVRLDRAKREENVAGAFRVPDSQRRHVAGRTVLLVDDVYTTGATARAATRALLRAGAQEVRLLTFSRVAAGVSPTHMMPVQNPGIE